MSNIWYKIALLGFVLTFVLAPFAGFAPLLLVILIASVYWFLGSVMQILIFGKPAESDRQTTQHNS